MVDPEIRATQSGQIADNGRVQICVDGGLTGRLFKRKAIKNVGTPNAREVCWMVGEITVNGAAVRVYVDGEKILMTTADVHP